MHSQELVTAQYLKDWTPPDETAAPLPATETAATSAAAPEVGEGRVERVFRWNGRRAALDAFVGAFGGLALAAMFGALAAFFGQCFRQPFGKNPPPPAVFLALAGVAGTVALGGLGFAGWVAVRDPRRRHFVVKSDGLLEVADAGDRLFRWEDLRVTRVPQSPFDPWYNLEAADGAATRIAPSTTDWRTLGELVRTRCEALRLRGDLNLPAPSGPAAQDVPAAGFGGGTPESFVARQSNVISDPMVFRFCRLGGRTLVLPLGAGWPLGLPPAPHAGLAGAVGEWARMQAQKKYLARKEALDAADEAGTLRLAAEYGSSYALQPGTVSEVRIEPPGLFSALMDSQRPVATLKFLHAGHGRRSFQLLTPEDARTAKAMFAALANADPSAEPLAVG